MNKLLFVSFVVVGGFVLPLALETYFQAIINIAEYTGRMP